MRKLKLQVQITADGFIAGPNGEMDWLVFNWDDKLKSYVEGITEPVDTIILGRKLAQGFIPHWASHPEMDGAEKINSSKKVVFTKTLDKSEWDNTELAKGDIVEEITKLKNQPGGDIIVYGGATFVSALIKAGLIDDYHLFVNPAAIGSGMAIFKDLNEKLHFTMTKSVSFECGIIVLNYSPKQG